MRKIKLPLEMANGTQVRSLEELKENFDIESVLGSFMNGKLLTWLNDRWLEDEAEQVQALSKNDPDLAAKLCRIFGVEYHAEAAVDAEEAAWRQERLARLRQYTEDEEILSNVDSVAFDQEDLADLYDMGVGTIYLCAGHFRIPKSKQHLKYIPLADATADGIELKKKEEAPIPTAPKRPRSTIKVGMTDGKLFKVENGNKTELAKFEGSVKQFVHNDQYAFVEVSGIAGLIRVDLDNGNQKWILERTSVHNLFVVDSFLVFFSYCPLDHGICKCDFDGDFKESLVKISGSVWNMQPNDGWVYYTHAEANLFDHELEKVNVETGEIVSLGSATHFCLGDGKLFVYSCQEDKISELDLDGKQLRTLMEETPTIDAMTYCSGVLSCEQRQAPYSTFLDKKPPIRIKV